MLAGCTRFEEAPPGPPPPPVGPPITRYGGSSLGQELRFRIRDTRFFADGDSSTVSWLRTETCDSLLTDPQGRRWSRYRIDSLPEGGSRRFIGRLYRLWTPDEFLEEEGIVVTRRLAQPLVPGYGWAPFPFNYLPPQPWGEARFVCQARDTVWQADDRRWDSVVVVRERRVENSINYNILTRSVYAPGRGLVYRYDRYKEFRTFSLPDGSLRMQLRPETSRVREWLRIN